MKMKWNRLIAFLLVLSMIGSVAAISAVYDLSGDGKTDVWDLQLAANKNKDAAEKNAALEEALGGADELHKNEKDQWEIWSPLGLFNMAKHAEAGDTFVLMQDIDMKGIRWTPVDNFKGTFEGGMHTISNVKITRSVGGNMGFFASIGQGGSVKYLNIKDMNLIASDDALNIGIMAGTCAGTIDGCTTIGFVTDERTTIPNNVYIGGMVGKMNDSGEIISRDINKLPSAAVSEIATISAKLGTRFATLIDETYVRSVGIVGDLGNGSVDVGTLLEDLTGSMPDPNAIAWVYTGETAVFPFTVEEMIAAIDSSGNSVVTLQKDITYTKAISLPYTCTIDCNGYTVATPATKNNGIQINAVGSVNETFTLKNGTLTHAVIGVCSLDGAVVLSNMTIVSETGGPVGLYATKDYSSINKIVDCTLVSKNWNVIAYNTDVDLSANGITIENSDLIAAKPGGNVLFGSKSEQPGTVTLGNNVNLYTYGDKLTGSVPLDGIDPFKLEDTASVTVLDQTYSGLNHWSTDESVITAELLAEVTNSTGKVEVYNVPDMIAAIEPDGNTEIKLVRDIKRSSQIKIPYSCAIDLNNYSITATSGNALKIAGVGTENTVTTIKNGRLNHADIGICVDTGSIDLSNVDIYGADGCGVSVAFYDPDGAYRADNKINECYIYNPYSECIKFDVADVEFKDTGVSISNTTLIAQTNYPFGVATKEKSGIIDLGQNVEIYGAKSTVGYGAIYRFLGEEAVITETTSVTVEGTEITGLNHWTTDFDGEFFNILLIGNSLSTTIPEELYNMATAAGKTVMVCNLYYPGCVANQHWDWLNNPNEENAYGANYQYRWFCSMGNIRRGDMSTSKNALDDRDWDCIVYQDYFDSATAFTSDHEANLQWLYDGHKEAAYYMMQYLKTNYPDAEHYYYQHWAWAKGHKATPNQNAQEAMWKMIETATTQFVEDNDFILIPCGAAYEMGRDDARIGDTLCQDDNRHDSGPNGGQYLNGCVFYETIFKETCIGNTWRGTNAPNNQKHLILQEIAHATVAQIHGEDYVKE